VDARETALAAAAGAGGFLLNQLGFVFGLDHTTVFSTALLVATSPIFALLGLAAWRLEGVRSRQWLGVAVASFGIAIFLSDGARLGLGWGIC
jgi:drug/metabolite transporter (DMT)-like permease